MKKTMRILVVMMVLLLGSVAVQAVIRSSTTYSGRSVGAINDVRVTFLNQDPDPVRPGQYVELRWKVENFGLRDNKEMLFTLQKEFPFELEVGETWTKSLDNLMSRQYGEDAAIIKWRVRINEKAVEGYEDIELTYTTGSFAQYKVTLKNNTVRIKTNDPIISVERASTLPELIAPGEKFKLNLNLKNLGDTSMYNVNAKLDLTGLPFAPVQGTNEKYIEVLSGKKSAGIEYELMSEASADSKAYQIPLKIMFSDVDNQQYEKNSTLGIVIRDPPQYILNVEESGVTRTAEKGTMIFSISNIGIADLNFVTLDVEESDVVKVLSAKTVYVGNLESDDFETTTYEIYVENTDQELIPINVRVSYKDSLNNQWNETRQVMLHLYNQDEAKKYGLVEQQSRSPIIYIVIVLGIVGFGVYRWRKKRSLKK